MAKINEQVWGRFLVLSVWKQELKFIEINYLVQTPALPDMKYHMFIIKYPPHLLS